MIRIQAGDFESFALLVSRNRKLLMGQLARLVRNEAIAQDLFQDVFIRVFRARAAYKVTAKFSTWLHRIAANVAFNYFRDHRHAAYHLSLDVPEAGHVRRRAVAHALSIEEQLVRNAKAEQVRSAVRALPLRQRAAMTMHLYEEMDYQAVATALGCSLSAIKALMFRAHETLRVRLHYTTVGGAPAKCGLAFQRIATAESKGKFS